MTVAAAGTAGAAVRARVVVSMPAAVSSVGRIVAKGSVVGARAGSAAVLEQRVGGAWRTRSRMGLRGPGTFSLWFRPRSTARTVAIRVVAVRRGRVVAASRTKRVAILPVAAGAAARFALPASSITSAPAAGAPGVLRVNGPVAARPGDIVAAGVGTGTPTGYLGRVSGVTTSGGATIVTATPVALIDAVPQGALNVAIGAAGAASDRHARIAASSDQSLARNVSCSAGGTLSISGSVSLTPSIKLAAHWGGYSFSHPLGHLDSASVTASLTASARAEAKATGTLGCTLDKTQIATTHLPTVTVDVLGLPVVLVPSIEWDIEGDAGASSTIDTDIHGSITASAGIAYDSHGFHPTGGLSQSFGFDPPTVTSTAHAEATLEPALHILLYGVAGPSLNFSAGLAFNADTTKSPWWTLTAPVKITGSLDAPDLKLHSGELTIYQHEFDIAHASGQAPGSGGTPPIVTPPSPTTSARHIGYWLQTPDLQCSLETVEDNHESFFSESLDDACGAFVVVDGTLYGPQTIPAGSDLGIYTPFTAVSQTSTGDGTPASPNVLTTVVEAGDSGVQLTETDTWTDNGTTVNTAFSLTGLSGDTDTVELYQAADCYVADSDQGTGILDATTGTPTCIHDNGDGTQVALALTPLTAGSTATEEMFSSVWSDIASQVPFSGNCSCDTELDNGFGLSWPVQLQGTTPVGVDSRFDLAP
jgi:hypothetical protein